MSVSNACLLARRKLSQAVSNATGPRGMDTAGHLVKSAYLATVRSGLGDILSSVLRIGTEAAIGHPAHVMADYLRHLATGSKRETASMYSTRAATEYSKAFAKGTKEFLADMRRGYDPERLGNQYQVSPSGAQNPIVRSAEDFISTWVSARNKPFHQGAFRLNLYRRAKVQALNEGLKGAQLNARTEALYRKPTDELAMGALADAEEMVFSAPTAIDEAVGGMRRSLRHAGEGKVRQLSLKERAGVQAAKEGLIGDAKAERVARLLSDPKKITVPAQAHPVNNASKAAGAVGGLAMDVTVPFVRFGANAAGTLIDYSPAGLVKALVEAKFAKKGEGKAIITKGIAHAAAGTAAGYALGYWLASNGKIEPPDSKHPFAYKDDKGNYHSLTAFSPFSMLPVMGAAFYFDQQKNPDKLLTNLAKAQVPFLKTVAKLTIINSMGRISGLVSDDPGEAESATSGMIPVPPLSGQVARGTTSKRDTRDSTFLGKVKKTTQAKIPGWNRSLPPRLDWAGREETTPGGLAGALLDPTSTARGFNTPADSAISRLRMNPKSPASYLETGDKKYSRTPDEQLAYERAAGELVLKAMNDKLGESGFRKRPVNQQKEILQDVIASKRKQAAGFVPKSYHP